MQPAARAVGRPRGGHAARAAEPAGGRHEDRVALAGVERGVRGRGGPAGLHVALRAAEAVKQRDGRERPVARGREEDVDVERDAVEARHARRVDRGRAVERPVAGAQAWPKGSGGAAAAVGASVRATRPASALSAARTRVRMAAERTPRPCEERPYARSAVFASMLAASRSSDLPEIESLNSRMPPPSDLPSSGSFFGPTTMSAMARTMISSMGPIDGM